MSMPEPLDVLVVSTDSRVAAIAASILRADNVHSICPSFSAAHVESPSRNSSFGITVNEHRFDVEVATSYYLIDAQRVDLWLALDVQSLERVRTYSMHNGPPPDSFYRGPFPEAVVPCGFDVGWMPSHQKDFDPWLRTLTENLQPWKQRIWDAFRDSS